MKLIADIAIMTDEVMDHIKKELPSLLEQLGCTPVASIKRGSNYKSLFEDCPAIFVVPSDMQADYEGQSVASLKIVYCIGATLRSMDEKVLEKDMEGYASALASLFGQTAKIGERIDDVSLMESADYPIAASGETAMVRIWFSATALNDLD